MGATWLCGSLSTGVSTPLLVGSRLPGDLFPFEDLAVHYGLITSEDLHAMIVGDPGQTSSYRPCRCRVRSGFSESMRTNWTATSRQVRTNSAITYGKPPTPFGPLATTPLVTRPLAPNAGVLRAP